MADGENIYVSFNEFDSSIKKSWRQLEIDEDFCDVTLACSGGEVQSQKVVVSACSPVIRSILKMNRSPHPIIYLRNVSYEVLKKLLQFMYQGEVNISEQNFNSFLDLARDLQVIGLTEENFNFLSI